MKRIIISLLLILSITTSAYAVNIFNRIFYDKVVLEYIHRYVLVNRLTGQVEYIMRLDGKWELVPKTLQNPYQRMYETQVN